MLLLAIRMPAPVHVRLSEYLKLGIWDQISKIKGQQQFECRAIRCPPLIILQDGTERHPDEQFRHGNSLYPSVIMEISNSQSKKDLAYLADQYIVETTGMCTNFHWHKDRLSQISQG